MGNSGLTHMHFDKEYNRIFVTDRQGYVYILDSSMVRFLLYFK